MTFGPKEAGVKEIKIAEFIYFCPTKFLNTILYDSHVYANTILGMRFDLPYRKDIRKVKTGVKLTYWVKETTLKEETNGL